MAALLFSNYSKVQNKEESDDEVAAILRKESHGAAGPSGRTSPLEFKRHNISSFISAVGLRSRSSNSNSSKSTGNLIDLEDDMPRKSGARQKSNQVELISFEAASVYSSCPDPFDLSSGSRPSETSKAASEPLQPPQPLSVHESLDLLDGPLSPLPAHLTPISRHSYGGVPNTSSSLQRTSAPSLGSFEDQSSNSQQSYDTENTFPSQNKEQQRELYIYAVPLIKDRLVFLPVCHWKEETKGVLAPVTAGFEAIGSSVSKFWHSMKDKDPSTLQHKIYKAGQGILENMTAEERLMRNIPKAATKLIIYHPTSYSPDQIQDQLTQLTSRFTLKASGKAAAAGVLLPVAVGLEILAVPGVGWYTAYQLFKSTSAAAGGSRLNTYLKNPGSEVRICYAGNQKLDPYITKAAISPDGLLGIEEIEDLCHELQEPALAHPLIELRMRRLKKDKQMNSDYALLPMDAPDDSDHSSHKKLK